MCREDNTAAVRSEDYRKQTVCQRYSMSQIVQMNYLNCHESPELNASDLKGLCVLIVDDSSDVATAVKMLLESWGADILGPVATVAEAERMIFERSPHMAIVDITLRGGEQSHSLIDSLCDKGIRVVVLTGDAEASSTGRVAAILQKPVREDLLLASLR